MNRKAELLHSLNTLEFNGNITSLETLFQSIEQLVFYFEARAQAKQAEYLMACNWQLKDRMQYDKEAQWLWTFVWMKEKVLRKLLIGASAPLSAEASASLSAGVEAKVEVEVEVEVKVEVRVDPSANLSTEAEVELQAFEVQEFIESSDVLSSPHHWLIGQSWERNTPLGIGSL